MESAGNVTKDSITIAGGNGGGGVYLSNSGGGGGGGGGVKLAADAVVVENQLLIQGGNGGVNSVVSNNSIGGAGGTSGGGGAGGTGGGGGGGGAMLAAASITVTSASGGIFLSSGITSLVGGGGGEARLEVTGTVSAPNITLTKNGGDLIFDVGALNVGTNGTTITSNVTDAGAVTFGTLAGSGTLTLNGGAATLTNAGTAGGISGNGALDLGGTLDLTNGTGADYSGVLSGTGGFTLSDGAQTLSGANSYTGTTTISGNGELTGIIGTSALVNNSTATYGYTLTADQSVASLDGTGATNLDSHTLTVTAGTGADYSGVLSGTGGFTLSGGTQTLSNAGNNAAGNTWATNIGSGTTLTGYVGRGALSNTGTFNLSGDQSAASLSGSGATYLGTHTLTVTDGTGADYSGVLSGAGGFTLSGGAQTLSNAGNNAAGNTWATSIESGTTLTGYVGRGALSNTGTFNLSGDQSVAALSGSGATNLDAHTLTVTDGTGTDYSGVLSGTGGFTLSGGAQTLSGANSYTGTTTISGNGELTGIIGTSALVNNSTAAYGYTLTADQSVTSLNGSGATNLDSHTLTVTAGTGADYSGVLSGTGGFTLSGGAQTLSGANSYTGTTTISGNGELTGIIGTSALVNNSTATYGYTLTADQSVASLDGTGATNLDSHTLTVTAGTGADYSGVLSGTGGFTLSGGTQTLSGDNDYTGPTIVSGGTLRLGGGAGNLSGSLSVTAARLEANNLRASNITFTGNTASADIGVLDVTTGNTDLTLNSTTAANIHIDAINLGGGRILTVAGGGYSATTLNVLGLNATYAGDLDANGMTLYFALADPLAQGDTMLTVQGDADLTGAAIVLEAVTPLTTLYATNDFNAIETTGSLTDGGFDGTRQQDALGNKYDLSATGNALVVTLVDPRTFAEIIADQIGGSGLNNENLEAGAGYLDELSQPGVIDAGLAKELDNAFKDAIAPGGVLASRSLQQFFGGYSAYANQALSDDMARFHMQWQKQNQYFFDARLFGDLLDSGREQSAVASGTAFASPRSAIPCGQSRVWAGGFGTWTKQDERSNLPGYKYDSRGAVLGYEYSLGNLNLGFAAAYSRGDLKVNDLRYKNEADVLNLAFYGAYIHESGFYAEGGFGYGHAWNDYKVDYIAVPGGVKKAKYGSDAFEADFELGYIARLPRDFNLIPSIGVEYTYLRNEGWTEKVNNPVIVANRFDSGHDHGVDIPLGLRFNKMFRFGCDGGFVVPEVRAAYVYSANKSRPSITAGYAGAPGGAKMVGVDPGRSHWRIGAGLSGRVNSRVDFRVEYDFETRSGFKGHNLNASVGLAF